MTPYPRDIVKGGESADGGEAGAPEIEISPEMIEAGVDVLFSFPITDPSESEMRMAVGAVFVAMSNRKLGRE